MLSMTASNQLAFAERIERYLTGTLHAPLRVEPARAPASQPVFIERAYDFYEAEILGRRCLFIAPREEPATPADIAKHVKTAGRDYPGLVIFAADAMSAHNRARLIGHGVPFIVPGNQLYVPALAMDLREHFRKRKERPAEGLSPAAQAVLFHHLLGRASDPTPTALAKALDYSAMTIGRAFDDLAAAGLARTEKRGRERRLYFNEAPRVLLDAAKTLLRSPVRSVKHVSGRMPTFPSLKFAGETALAKRTDLAPPQITTYASAASNWKGLAAEYQLEEVEQDKTSFAIELWNYDPGALSDEICVDPLSLYAQFWDHADERVAMAAEKLLEALPW